MIADDGAVIAGLSDGNAVRWIDELPEAVTPQPPGPRRVTGISADGAVLSITHVNLYYDPFGASYYEFHTAHVWADGALTRLLGTYAAVTAEQISADGDIVIGTVLTPGRPPTLDTSYRFSSGGTTLIEPSGGSPNARVFAQDCSADRGAMPSRLAPAPAQVSSTLTSFDTPFCSMVTP